MIAAQNRVIIIHVVLSTPPNQIVPKTGTTHTKTMMAELILDDFSPMITFSA